MTMYGQQVFEEHYGSTIEDIRKTEYPYMSNECYLDHAGTTLYSQLLIRAISSQMMSGIFANPHSGSLLSRRTDLLIDDVRLQVLNLFGCDPFEYGVIFTSNATHAIKILVQDGFCSVGPFDYLYADNCHTSAIGIREYARRARLFSVQGSKTVSMIVGEDCKEVPLLVCWSGQSNFNGARVGLLDIVPTLQANCKNEYYTLYDISSLSTTCPPNIRKSGHLPDFMVCSFYKMFGLPDLGALVFRKSSAAKVFANKRFFGGGTVDALTISDKTSFFRHSSQLTTKLEDGTLPIHSIISLKEAIRCHQQIFGSFDNISKHVTALSLYAVERLCSLRHSDTDKPMVEILGKFKDYGNPKKQGPIIAMFLHNKLGNRTGYQDFETIVSLKNISIRTGTLCNIGGYLHWSNNELSDADISTNYFEHSHKCGDSQDIINGKITGAIRISLGAMSSRTDIDIFCNSIEEFFTDTLIKYNQKESNKKLTALIKALYIYPIKSCHFYKIPEDVDWEIDEVGLQFDRFFCLLDINTKEPLRLKHCTHMVNIKPVINLATTSMHIDWLVVPLSLQGIKKRFNTELHLNSKEGIEYISIVNPEVISFFQNLLEIPCLLSVCRAVANNSDIPMSLQNKSPFLMISQPSVDHIKQRFINEQKSTINEQDSTINGQKHHKPTINVEHLFRANILVGDPFQTMQAFEEDFWKTLRLVRSQPGALEIVFDNYLKCDRCHMITINQDTGERDSSVFMQLNATRKSNGKVYFGQNLRLSHSSNGTKRYIRVNDVLHIEHAP